MEKQYYLDPDVRRQALLAASFLIVVREICIAGLVFSSGRYDSTRITLYVGLLLVLIGALLHIISAYTERITISSAGITFKTVGFGFFVRWEDVDRIGPKRILGISYQQIIARKDKVKMEGFGWIYGREISINLLRYSDNWRESELGQQIKQYAPQLLA